MRILHTVPSLNASAGGPTTCIYSLLKGLNDIGIHADVLTLGNNNLKDELVGNDSFVKVVENDAVSPLVYSRNLKKYLFQNEDYDLYHANAIWTYPSHLTKLIAKSRNKPFVLSPHGMLYPQALKVSAWKKKIILPLFQWKDLQQADCLHATCQAELEHIRNLGLKNPIAVVPNCLNIDMCLEFRTTNSIKRFGFVGRLNRYKNIDILLEAWRELGDKTINAELFIIGDGDIEYKRKLESFVLKYNLNNVRFLGFLKGDTLKSMVHSLDFQVLPSKSENFGMVVLEALTNRVPVIASKGTPWEELNIYNCGWWIDGLVNPLTQALIEALAMPEIERLAMGERGRQLVLSKFTVEKVTLQMSDLYNWLIYGGDKPECVDLY